MTTIALTQTTNSGLDRTFLYASSLLAEPFCKAYELICYIDRIESVAMRALVMVGALFIVLLAALHPISFFATVLSLGMFCKLFRAIGFALQKEGYTHVRTAAPEQPLGAQTSIFMQNLCGMCGGMHWDHGDVRSWRSRVDAFVDKVKELRPHTIILQEIYDTALAEALVEKLGDVYPHFFMHLGENIFGSVGGVMMITDHPVQNFRNISFHNNDWTLNRTFALLDFDRIQIIGTHLIHGNNTEKRKEQFEQIRQFVGLKTTFIGADFNIERDKEGLEILTPYLNHGYKDPEPTCTGDEMIDNISEFGRGRHIVRVDLIRAFDDPFDPKTALSDHHGLFATINT